MGTLAAFGEDGPAVAEKLAAHLGLPCPAFSWHTERSRIAEIGAWLGILTGLLGKIAGDIILAMQTEVAELGEPAAAGKGGSSAMPHKRNPVMTTLRRRRGHPHAASRRRALRLPGAGA